MRVLQPSKEEMFFCSVDHLSGPLRKLVFFEAFYDLSYSCLLQEYSNVCFLSSTKIPLVIAISFAILEYFRVILNFVFVGQAGVSALLCDLD